MSALQELASSTQLLFNIRCDFKCDRAVPIDDTATAVHLYRIAQEAITNAVKHGRAESIQMELNCGSHESTLIVKNDGLDFPESIPKSEGMGLQIMDHRVEMIGGRLNILRHAEGGTVLSCAFPNKNPKIK
jgi:signal transduction histidine kinase